LHFMIGLNLYMSYWTFILLFLMLHCYKECFGDIVNYECTPLHVSQKYILVKEAIHFPFLWHSSKGQRTQRKQAALGSWGRVRCLVHGGGYTFVSICQFTELHT
jgi:hypothetical protein